MIHAICNGLNPLHTFVRIKEPFCNLWNKGDGAANREGSTLNRV